MERLTKKTMDGRCQGYDINIQHNESSLIIEGAALKNCVHKLGNLEDFEEKHNIDLSSALSILDNGIWVRRGDAIIHIKPTLGFRDNNYYFEHDYFVYLPEHYGETWALTKEELERKQN